VACPRDLDGNRYVDIASSFGANFLGHSHPAPLSEVHRQLAKGFALGMQNDLASEAARLICELTGNERCSEGPRTCPTRPRSTKYRQTDPIRTRGWRVKLGHCWLVGWLRWFVSPLLRQHQASSLETFILDNEGR